jgi:hypothetical protein
MAHENHPELVSIRIAGNRYALASELDVRQALRLFGIAFSGGELDGRPDRELFLAELAWHQGHLANALRDALAGKAKRGRPRRDDGLWLIIVKNLIRLCDQCGFPPTQTRVARWLQIKMDDMDAPDDGPPGTKQRRNQLSAKRTDRDRQSIVKFLQRLCQRHKISWEEMVRLARARQ